MNVNNYKEFNKIIYHLQTLTLTLIMTAWYGDVSKVVCQENVYAKTSVTKWLSFCNEPHIVHYLMYSSSYNTKYQNKTFHSVPLVIQR